MWWLSAGPSLPSFLSKPPSCFSAIIGVLPPMLTYPFWALIVLSPNLVWQSSVSLMWCGTWTGNSVAWCDTEWDAASWCDCIGKREEWYYGRRAEKKLVPCRDGATPYHIISNIRHHSMVTIPYGTTPYHIIHISHYDTLPIELFHSYL